MNTINCSKFFLILKPPESPFNPLSASPQKMIKHTQTIHWLLPTNSLSVFDHFVGLVLIGLTYNLQLYWKRCSGIYIFLWILNFFTNIFFMEHLPETASEKRVLQKLANQHFYYKEISWNLKLFQRTNVAREGEVCDSHLIKGNIVLTRNFLYMLLKTRQNP